MESGKERYPSMNKCRKEYSIEAITTTTSTKFNDDVVCWICQRADWLGALSHRFDNKREVHNREREYDE